MIENPFKYGQIVSGNYFTDREKEIEEIKLDLLSGQNLIIYSPRRYGKTSLILKVLRELRKRKVICIYVDLFKVFSKLRFAEVYSAGIAREISTKRKDFLQVLRDILPSIIPKVTVKGDNLPTFEIEYVRKEVDVDRLLSRLYEQPQIIASKRKKRVVVVFDEFQEVRNISQGEIEKELRSAVQHHQDVAYVFMGSKRHLIDLLFFDKKEPLYLIGKHLPLGKIPAQNLSKFISQRFAFTGINIKQDKIQFILDVTQCHPYYTQALCHEIWNLALGSKNVTSENIKSAIAQLIFREAYAYTTIWDSLTAKQQSFLFALTKEKEAKVLSKDFVNRYNLESTSTVQKIVKSLVKREIIEKINNSYSIRDPFFAEWIKREI